jgi:Transposase protein
MTSTLTGQLILGTDRRNPLFSVYEHEKGQEQELHVYYGMELLEVVSADRSDPNFKMLVGRLYNARLSRRALQETFEVDLKTIQRWGRALRSKDAKELIRVLEGRKVSRKLTPEIEAYVRMRWPDLAQEGLYGIGKRLREEIQRIFKVKLSQETLRPLMGELRRQRASAAGAGGGTPEAIARALPQCSQEAADNQELSSEVREKVCDCVPVDPLPEPVAQQFPLEGVPQTLWCDHLGILLFTPVLITVAEVVKPAQALFKQWLASLLTGALNIEQTKFLNWPDLSRLLGTVVRSAHPQRQELEGVATQANIEALARFNAEQIGAESQSQFYFDPHTKHYTGQENVLKGWCASIRSPDKAMHSDFIHTIRGEPLYFETTDNFADVRERFFAVVKRLRAVMKWPLQRVLTFVLDRAIFGGEVFEKVLADATLHLITWEKGYKAQEWPPPGGITGTMVIERARNRAQDIRSYHLEYWDRPWPKEERLRQMVVQATNPAGRVIQVSILTDDQKAAAVKVIGWMFNRWVQENDFKYLDKHFGINQITSYGVSGYAELRHQVEDREVRSAEVKALREQGRQLRIKQGRLLLLQADGEQQERQRQQRIKQLEDHPEGKQTAKELARLRQSQSRWEGTHSQRAEQITKLANQRADLDVKARNAQEKESRLERLIEQKMVRLDPEKKRLMDSLRVIARNVFYKTLQPFKKVYNNYRDDHDQFRQLTQASGVLEVRTDQIVVHLMPRVNYPPRLRRILTTVLEDLNAQQPVLPDGSGRRLRLRLARRSEMKLSIQTKD